MAKPSSKNRIAHEQVMVKPSKGSAHSQPSVTPPGTTVTKSVPTTGPMSPNMGKGILPKGKY